MLVESAVELRYDFTGVRFSFSKGDSESRVSLVRRVDKTDERECVECGAENTEE